MTRLDDLMAQSRTAANDVASNEPAVPFTLETLRSEPEIASATEIDRASIEMLTRVFRFALEDESIPSTLKVLIGSLQLPVLKAALEDRAFFVTAKHPARRFVDLLARMGMYWNDDPADPLHESVQAIVARARDGAEDATVLFGALDLELEQLLFDREAQFSERDAVSIEEIAKSEARHDGGDAADGGTDGEQGDELGRELEAAAEVGHEGERQRQFNGNQDERDAAELGDVAEDKARAQQNDAGFEPELVGGDACAEDARQADGVGDEHADEDCPEDVFDVGQHEMVSFAVARDGLLDELAGVADDGQQRDAGEQPGERGALDGGARGCGPQSGDR